MGSTRVKLLVGLPIFIFLMGCSTGGDVIMPSNQFSFSSNAEQQAGEECQGMNYASCDMHIEINKIREENGLSALKIHTTCVRAAQSHAEDMFEQGFFAHDGPNETWLERMQRYNLTGNSLGENIAYNFNIEDTVTAWLNSPVHYQNIIDPSFKSTGIGFRAGYYVQCFSAQE